MNHEGSVMNTPPRWSLNQQPVIQRLFPVLVLAILAAHGAYAHPVFPGGDAASLMTGLAHPLTGLDHVLGMLAIGLWAGQRAGRALLAIPLAALAAIILGGTMGLGGLAVPGVETWIVASILCVGLAVACALRVRTPWMAAAAALFAFFHGHAHGSELAAGAAPLAYGVGFVAASGMICAAGAAIGHAVRSVADGRLLRAAGGAIIAGGAVLCFA